MALRRQAYRGTDRLTIYTYYVGFYFPGKFNGTGRLAKFSCCFNHFHMEGQIDTGYIEIYINVFCTAKSKLYRNDCRRVKLTHKKSVCFRNKLLIELLFCERFIFSCIYLIDFALLWKTWIPHPQIHQELTYPIHMILASIYMSLNWIVYSKCGKSLINCPWLCYWCGFFMLYEMINY